MLIAIVNWTISKSAVFLYKIASDLEKPSIISRSIFTLDFKMNSWEIQPFSCDQNRHKFAMIYLKISTFFLHIDQFNQLYFFSVKLTRISHKNWYRKLFFFSSLSPRDVGVSCWMSFDKFRSINNRGFIHGKSAKLEQETFSPGTNLPCHKWNWRALEGQTSQLFGHFPHFYGTIFGWIW